MPREKAYAQLVKEWDEKIEAGHEAEGLTPVTVKVNPTPQTMVSLRLSEEDFVMFSQAAKDRGLGMSAFLRQAAYALIQGESDLKDGERYSALDEARLNLRSAMRAVDRVMRRDK
jgi:hypothetical protein